MITLTPLMLDHPVGQLMAVGARTYSARVSPTLEPQLGWPSLATHAYTETFAFYLGLQFTHALHRAARGRWRVDVLAQDGETHLHLHYALAGQPACTTTALSDVADRCLFTTGARQAVRADTCGALHRLRQDERSGLPTLQSAADLMHLFEHPPYAGIIQRLAHQHTLIAAVHAAHPDWPWADAHRHAQAQLTATFGPDPHDPPAPAGRHLN